MILTWPNLNRVLLNQHRFNHVNIKNQFKIKINLSQVLRYFVDL
jgi:hypothetical protein